VKLITEGPYRFSRNPIYVLLAFSMLSLGLLLMSVWLIGGSVLLVVVLHHRVIPGEENELRTRFPVQYNAYRQKTPRWLFING
jgi:protein-S-isoprenylcysteine O-methyltransferase Ste14